MRISYEQHIASLQGEVDEIDVSQKELKVHLQELKQKSADYQHMTDRKYKLQAAIEHLRDLVEVTPEVQAALHPANPFGDAAEN